MARIRRIFERHGFETDRLAVDSGGLRRVCARIGAAVGEDRRREEVVERSILLNEDDNVRESDCRRPAVPSAPDWGPALATPPRTVSGSAASDDQEEKNGRAHRY